MVDDLSGIYQHRFSAADNRELAQVWKVLVEDFFSRWIDEKAAVLDVGAGACHFINHVRARERVAFDANPDVATNCAPGVEFLRGDHPAVLAGRKFDVMFVSNFLEHLANGKEIISVLKGLHPLLSAGGRVIVLQPNFALLGAKYFDFVDHSAVLTDHSLREALEVSGYRIIHFRKRFLPYTSKSRFPRTSWLVRLYLRLPFVQWIFGKQTLVIAETKHRRPIP